MENESKILGVSMRGWLAFILISTVCLLAMNSMEMQKIVGSLAAVAAGYYFGQKSK